MLEYLDRSGDAPGPLRQEWEGIGQNGPRCWSDNSSIVMGILEIVHQLERCQAPFPKILVDQAVAHREEITPELLLILERVTDAPATYASDGEYFGHIFAMFLLAKFRETRAYPLLLRIVSIPGQDVFDLLGDTVTENLGSILASVSGGDDSGLRALIENPSANEFVRSAAMQAMVTLVATGQRSRDEVIAYFAELFHRLEREPNYVWSELANICADLCPVELQAEIEQAYDDDLIDPHVIDRDDIRDAIQLGVDKSVAELHQRRYRLIDDLKMEMGWMSGFHPRGERSGVEEALPEDDDDEFEAVDTYRRAGPKIGRNDPCPCGSKKKFKKCCGK